MRITLKAARVNAGLTLIEAAKRIGVSRDTLRNWERGKTFPSSDKIAIICEVYNCHYDAIQWKR